MIVATSVPLSFRTTLLFLFVVPLTSTESLVIEDHFSGVVIVIGSLVPVFEVVPLSSTFIVIDPPASSTASVTVSSWFHTRLNVTHLLSLREPLSLSLNCTLLPWAGIVAPKSVSL